MHAGTTAPWHDCMVHLPVGRRAAPRLILVQMQLHEIVATAAILTASFQFRVVLSSLASTTSRILVSLTIKSLACGWIFFFRLFPRPTRKAHRFTLWNFFLKLFSEWRGCDAGQLSLYFIMALEAEWDCNNKKYLQNKRCFLLSDPSVPDSVTPSNSCCICPSHFSLY